MEEYYVAFDFDKQKVGFTSLSDAGSRLTMGLVSALVLLWSLVSFTED